MSRFVISIKTICAFPHFWHTACLYVCLYPCIKTQLSLIMNWTVSVILTISQMLPLVIDPSGSQWIPKGNINSIMLPHQYQVRISVPVAAYWTHSICVSCFKSKQALRYLSLGITVNKHLIQFHIWSLCLVLNSNQQWEQHRAILHGKMGLQQILSRIILCHSQRSASIITALCWILKNLTHCASKVKK